MLKLGRGAAAVPTPAGRVEAGKVVLGAWDALRTFVWFTTPRAVEPRLWGRRG
jgi:hypothetical protein